MVCGVRAQSGWVPAGAAGHLGGAHFEATKASARLTKLPKLASSSLLFFAARSLHLKSVSLVSGRLLSRK